MSNELNSKDQNSKETLSQSSNNSIGFDSVVTPQQIEDKPCGCKSSMESDIDVGIGPSYIYSIGRIEPRFPTKSIEKEFAQVMGREDTKELTDRQALQSILSQRQNRYLSRKLCWILKVGGLETYILNPRNPEDIDLLIESLRPNPRLNDVDVVIGVRGPISSLEMCNGLALPIVSLDQIYSFDIETLIKSLPRPEKIPAKEFASTAEDLFIEIKQMTDNSGATDEHRALNYLSIRYPAIYSKTTEMFFQDCSLTSIEVKPSPISTVRNIVDVVFSYTNRNTDVVEKYFVRVDVTENFPFLVTKMSPYFDVIR